jgi:ribosomal protein S27AE
MNRTISRVICPRCGTPMNHHADKLVETSSSRDAADVDPDLGGIVEETHACPKCGNVEFRRAHPGRA